MEVTRDNFTEVLPAVREALSGCDFFAFDLEMSGLTVRHNRGPTFYEDIHDKYAQMLEAAQSFQLTQFGLSAFAWDGDAGAYIARTFNFFVFPRPVDGADRRFLSQASSMDFLARQGFDFNKWVRSGIGYTSAASRDARLAALARERGDAETGNSSLQDIVVTEEQDKAFLASLAAEVTAWVEGSDAETLQLPAVNGFLRRLQYQHLHGRGSASTSGFVVERVVNESRRPALRLRRAAPQDAAALAAQQAASRGQAVHDAAGFTAVFEAMRDCGAPAVGHNLAFDLAFSLEAFAGPLPASWQEYKALTAAWFPSGVFDTRHLATQLPEVFGDQVSLGEVFDVISGTSIEPRNPEGEPASLAAAGIAVESMPAVAHATGFARYKGEDAASFAHEAGYDAYMTASAFAGLLRLLELRQDPQSGAAGFQAQQSAIEPRLRPLSLEAAAPHAWRVNVSRSDIPYAALAGEDPQPDRRHVFHLEGLPPGSRHHDIAAAFAAAGLGRVLTAVLDAGGTSAAVAVLNSEAAPRVQAALATWGPQVQLYEQWARARRDQQAAAAQMTAPAAADTPMVEPTNGHGRIKRRRAVAPAQADTSPDDGPDRAQRSSCNVQ